MNDFFVFIKPATFAKSLLTYPINSEFFHLGAEFDLDIGTPTKLLENVTLLPLPMIGAARLVETFCLGACLLSTMDAGENLRSPSWLDSTS